MSSQLPELKRWYWNAPRCVLCEKLPVVHRWKLGEIPKIFGNLCSWCNQTGWREWIDSCWPEDPGDAIILLEASLRRSHGIRTDAETADRTGP